MTATLSPQIPVVSPKPTAACTSIVAEAAVSAAATEVEAAPNYVAIYTSTIAVVTLVFLVGVGLPASFAYGQLGGWGLGAFCAFWGGPAFGVMAASARVSAWFEAHEAH